MSTLIAALKRNRVFAFFSSVRLAIPLMLIIIVCVATGTVLESLYSSAYARLAIYDTSWFFGLMVILWLNVFCAMMSRYPWKKHHVGFVTTHIGMMTLLAGAFITSNWGVDGTLQIGEGQSNSSVVLPQLMLGYALEGVPSLQSVRFERTLFEKSQSQLGSLNDILGHVLIAERYIPFAQVERSYTSTQNVQGPMSVSFILKSQFFNVSQWLHSTENPEMQLGPAHLKLVIDSPKTKRKPSSDPVKAVAPSGPKPAPGTDQLVVSDASTHQNLLSISLTKLQKSPQAVRGIKIQLTKKFHHAVVAENKIVDDKSNPSPNPAIEITLTENGKVQREVLYAKYPNFSLNKNGNFGLQFKYENLGSDEAVAADTDTAQLPAGHPTIDSSDSQATASAPAMGSGPNGNTIEFHLARDNAQLVHVVLIKGGQKVGEKDLREGESFQTPWMGMTIFVGSIVKGAESVVQAKAVSPEPGKDLPPGALFIRTAGSREGFWLAQGEEKRVEINNRPAIVVFANQTLTLPFDLKLDKFTKFDYPGTETAMSYESLVQLSRDKSLHNISMNDPLKEAGYTLYQSSYILNPNEPPTTVLSVNKDPGRWIKYFGALVLALGIITFTLMRSRVYSSWR